MGGRRKALIIAVDRYDDPGLGHVRSPMVEADVFAAVLGDPRIGGFEVDVMLDAPAHEIWVRIEDLCTRARADDLSLLYLAGLVLEGDGGERFFATRDTRPALLRATGLSFDFVQRCMQESASRTVLLVDCYLARPFGKGITQRASGDAPSHDGPPPARSRSTHAIMSVVNSVGYRFESAQPSGELQTRTSAFTAALIEGIGTGEADRDGDGLVSVHDLYAYVVEKIREQDPGRMPMLRIENLAELYLARGPSQPPWPAEPAELDASQSMGEPREERRAEQAPGSSDQEPSSGSPTPVESVPQATDQLSDWRVSAEARVEGDASTIAVPGVDDLSVAGVTQGSLAFNPPPRMRQGRAVRIEVGIARTADLTDMMVAELQGQGVPVIEHIRTARLMEVTLRGEHFDIASLSPAEQLLAPQLDGSMMFVRFEVGSSR